MILRIILIVVIVVAAILLFAATRPDTLRIQRSIVINAPPQIVFDLINDLHRWKDWQEQYKNDASVTMTFSGPASGVGSMSQWNGQGSVGRGEVLITESQVPDRIVAKVDFVKPFASHNINEFDLEGRGQSTRLTWTWQGQNLYPMKVMGIFTNMDRMIGQHFDAGLNNLKTVAEK